jgi:hypothetical protein
MEFLMANGRILALLLCLLLTANAFSDVIRDGSFQAKSQTAGVLVQWMSDNETNVAGFVIERSVQGNADAFVVIHKESSRGVGTQYTWLDDTAFKTTDAFYRYRITPVDASGNQAGPQKYTQLIRSSISSVRRTWGSIKAMFR